MSKVFVYLFGVLSGVMITIATVAQSISGYPDDWKDIADLFKKIR